MLGPDMSPQIIMVKKVARKARRDKAAKGVRQVLRCVRHHEAGKE